MSPTSTEPCFLMYLSQELQDMIFVFAHPEVPTGTQVVSKRGWERDQQDSKKRHRAAHQPKAFPEPKVSDLMVSKAFFLGAAKAYVRAQKWTINNDSVVPNLFGGEETTGNTVCHQFVRQVTMTSAKYSEELWRYQSLQYLSFMVDDADFDDLESKNMWEDECDEEDFQSLELTAVLSKLRGLKRLSITAGWCIYANTPAKEQIWWRNVDSFAGFMRDIVSRPKALPNATAGEKARKVEPNLLCSGSRVRIDSSQLQPESEPYLAFRPGRPLLWVDRDTPADQADDGTGEKGEGNQEIRVESVPTGPRLVGQGSCLNDAEIPDSAAGLVALLLSEWAEGVMAWVRMKKERT